MFERLCVFAVFCCFFNVLGVLFGPSSFIFGTSTCSTQSLNTEALLYLFALPLGVTLVYNGHSFHSYHSPFTFSVYHIKKGEEAVPSLFTAQIADTHCLL